MIVRPRLSLVAPLGLVIAILGVGACERADEHADRLDSQGPGGESSTRSDPDSEGVAAERNAVIARLGVDIAPPAGLPAYKRIRMHHVTRPGFCVRAPRSFEVAAPREAELLSFAAAVAPVGRAPEGAPPSVVRVHRGSTLLASQTLDEHDLWYPTRVSLAGGENSEALRFSVEAELGTVVCWASIDFEALELPPSPRPNVLLISLDTLGASYLGSHEGLEGISPRIDAFLGESFEFRRAIASFGNTLVSHSSLFSAQYPRVHQRYSANWDWKGLPPLESLMEAVAADGYRSVAFTEDGYVGSGFGFDAGFDSFDDGESDISPGHAARTFGRAMEWLDERGRDSRFFLFVHTYEVHSPYVPKTPEGRTFADGLTPGDRRIFNNQQTHAATVKHLRGEALLTPREQRRLRALYNAELQELDAVVGRLLDTLERLDLERDTLVVLTADHGEAFGEDGQYGHGISLHNRVMHVPLAFRWPGAVSVGRSEEAVHLLDGMTTILDLVGLEAPEASQGRRDGRSLAPLLRSEEIRAEVVPVFSELIHRCGLQETGPLCWIEHYAVQTRRYKLVRSRDGSFERFYDLERDPEENRNRAADPSLARVLAQHRAWLDEYLATTPDVEVIASGGARSPKGADDPAAEERDAEMRERLKALGYIE